MTLRPIRRALISVSDKTGLEELVHVLKRHNISILSTGGTATTLRNLGAQVTDIADYTGFPEILDGRVKTLHPKVHGGLLARTDLHEHQAALEEHHIEPIDLVVVNLYPFEDTVAGRADYEDCIENIDIGGPSMIRSAAKNHAYTTVITAPSQYSLLAEELDTHQGSTRFDFRQTCAAQAFAKTAAYDTAISQWFQQTLGSTPFPETLLLSAKRHQLLRYGENPHQQAAVYVHNTTALSVANAEQIQGKELSYNNIHDADAALELVSEFSEPAVAIIKHANPCGVALGNNALLAYQKALACDPISAFGGIIALNRPLDAATATAISYLFTEVIIAPEADAEAKAILAAKKNLRLLLTHQLPNPSSKILTFKSILGGLLIQERDHTVLPSLLSPVTKRTPTQEESKDLAFAFTVCKHVRSNAIVLAKDQATVGIGAGQMSRVDSVRIACLKASEGEGNKERAYGAVIASDAFFPFADGLELAAQAGIIAAIQPGGSVRDEEVIAAANTHNVAMVFTGCRHFKH